MTESEVKILIVEDDPIIAEDIHSLLLEAGYRVAAVAHDATMALDALSKGSIDFAILDIHLGGGQTGIDVAEVIHDVYRIPFIFLTSFDDDATLQAAQENSPYGYLVKPFHDRSLLTTIKVALTNYRSAQKKKGRTKEDIEKTIGTSLTDQEHTILMELLDGKSYKQIALSIHISANTVKYHAGNIYNKCDVKGRSELPAKLLS